MLEQDLLPSSETSHAHPLKKVVFYWHGVAAIAFPCIPHWSCSLVPWSTSNHLLVSWKFSGWDYPQPLHMYYFVHRERYVAQSPVSMYSMGSSRHSSILDGQNYHHHGNNTPGNQYHSNGSTSRDQQWTNNGTPRRSLVSIPWVSDLRRSTPLGNHSSLGTKVTNMR